MRYTIEGFNQAFALTLKTVVEKNGKLVERKIDCTDLVILRWFVDFYPTMRKMEIDGKQYAWVSHNKLIEDLPLIDITKRSFIDRLQKLVSFDILSYKFVKEQGSSSYYGFGSAYKYLVEKPKTNDVPNAPEQMGGMQSNNEGVCNQTHTIDNSIIYNTIIDKKENKESSTSVEKTNLDTPTQAESAEPSPSRNENQLASSLIADNANPVDGTSAKKANQVGDDKIDNYFESTYKLYPRHESKVQGKKTYIKKLKGMSEFESYRKAIYIYKCLEKQIACWQAENRDKKYIPLISSWLNANFEDGKEK